MSSLGKQGYPQNITWNYQTSKPQQQQRLKWKKTTPHGGGSRYAPWAFATPIFVASATPIFVASATPYFRISATQTAATPKILF